MFCAQCGIKQPNDAQFCPKCGATTTARTPASSTLNRSAVEPSELTLARQHQLQLHQDVEPSRRGIARAFIVASSATAACVVGAWFYFTPHITAKQMQQAAEARDPVQLAQYVDFPSLKESIKSNLSAMFMKEMGDDSSPAAALGTALGMAMIGPIVDAMVTPQNLAALIQGKKPNLPGRGDASSAAPADVEIAMAYESFDRFAIKVTRNSSSDSVHLVLHRDGLASWKLGSLRLNFTSQTPMTAKAKEAEPTTDAIARGALELSDATVAHESQSVPAQLADGLSLSSAMNHLYKSYDAARGGTLWVAEGLTGELGDANGDTMFVKPFRAARFTDGERERVLLVTHTLGVEGGKVIEAGSGCHACGSIVGMFMFERAHAGTWSVLAADHAVTRAGAWGRMAPAEVVGDFNAPGLQIEDSYTAQGQTFSSTSLARYEDGGFRVSVVSGSDAQSQNTQAAAQAAPIETARPRP